MVWNLALAKLMKEKGDSFSIKEIGIMREALIWYDGDIPEDDYEDFIYQITRIYINE